MSLQIENVSKLYGKQWALKHIDLNLEEGEIVGFLGPNGAGKTTLMKIITGYIAPTEGHVSIYGQQVTPDNLSVKRQIGYLPEHNPLYLDMYVKEYLSFVGSCYGLGKELPKRVTEMIALTGLEREQQKKIGQLSKGYRQRVGLAQALIHDPKILILDEPTTGLDPNQLIEIRQLIRETGRNKTILFSTHILQEVQALCQRVIVINQGELVSDIRVEDLNKDQDIQIYEVEFNRSCPETIAKDIEGIIECSLCGNNKYKIHADRDIRESLFKYATENNLSLLTLQQIEESIEEMFHRITQAH